MTDVAATRPQARYSFTIPESARQWPTDPKNVVLQQITLSEEQRAAEVSGGAGFKFAYEALKASIVEADGVAVTWAEGQKDRFIEGCSPRVRSLLMKAYDKLHIPPTDEGDSFFDSMTVTV